MKKIIREESDEGLEKLLGKKVEIYCCRYIYYGELIGVNDLCILLEDASIIYETGSFSEKEYSDIQSLCRKEWYVQLASIESFGIAK